MSNELPKGWAETDIGEISDRIHYGYTAKSEKKPIGTKLLRITDIQNNEVDWNEVPHCKISESDKKKYLLEPNDLVFARTGATVGKSYLIPQKLPESVFASYLIRVILNSNISPKYIYNFFQSHSYWIQIKEGSAGIGQPNVNATKLSKIKLPLPPLPEQKRIVSKIEELVTRLDAGIESLKQVQALLKRYRQSVLKSAVEGKLTADWRKQNKDELKPADKLLEGILKERKEKWEAEQLTIFKTQGKKPPKNWQGKYKEPTPPDAENLPELPEGWIWGKLSTISKVVSGYAFKSKDFIDSGIPVIKIANVSYGEFLWKQQEFLPKEFYDDHQAFQVTPGTILIALTRPITNDTVKACIYPENEPPALLNQRVAMIKPYKGINKQLLGKIIQSELFKKQIEDGLSETLQPNLSPKDLNEFPIPIPPEFEQKKIVENVDNLYSIIDQSKKIVASELKRSQSLRQSILKHAFEGKLVPQDPNDEPASVLLERIKAEKSNLQN